MTTAISHSALTHLLATQLGVPVERTAPESTLRGLGLDSLALIELTMMIDRDFGVVLDDDALQPGTTLADTVALVESKGVRL